MKYGLIGEKLSHSFSPQIHSMLKNDDYILVPLTLKELDEFMKRHDFSAINVTIPYKESVMKYCDYISPEAKKINSVNTIVNKGGKLYGYNTDYFGFSYMCKAAGISFEHKKVVILGSGGTSLTAQAVLNDCGADEIVVVSRTGKDNYNNIEKHYNSDILINTTPIGMFPNRSNIPVSLNNFNRLSGVVEVIYNPLKTKLLQNAKELGIKTTCGLVMLVSQAIKADSLFFGDENTQEKQPEDIKILEIVKKIESSVCNIVLIGMPGCGKSTIGKLLAKKLNLPFFDTDEEIERRAGITIPQIFESYGEAHFRSLESEVIKDICKDKMQVISIGGGSLMNENNRTELCYNGKLIWLDRSIEKLATNGRPLSKSKEQLALLYEQRAPIYQKFCDKHIIVKEQPIEVLNDIISYLK